MSERPLAVPATTLLHVVESAPASAPASTAPTAGSTALAPAASAVTVLPSAGRESGGEPQARRERIDLGRIDPVVRGLMERYAALYHGGDMAAACRHLLVVGLQAAEPTARDVLAQRMRDQTQAGVH